MKRLFEEEFKDLPPKVREILEDRLEESIRKARIQWRASIRDENRKAYDAQQLCAMFHMIFSFAEDFKKKMKEE